MKREIKFRGRDDVNNWHYGTYHYSNDGQYHYILNREKFIDVEPHFSYLHEQETHLVSSETVGQYTGVKDADDKEIYEGDIIDGMIVTYCGNQEKGLGMNCGWYLQRSNFESWIELESRCNYNGDNHIIQGNISDNPELVS